MKVDSEFLLSGQRFPPGFRFHPTDEELLLYYLKRKICCKRRRLDVITETDVYKWDPEELPEMSKLKTGDRQWFFFSPRDRKYTNKSRSNRATGCGYWKATGKDRVISYGARTVGIKKTLVFYRGRAPSGERTDWVMHEYTLNEEELKKCKDFKEYYALYKVYKKSGPGPKNGEQYGAPFREEEWDEEDLEVQFPIEQEKPTKQASEIVPFDDTRTVQCQDDKLSIDDLDEILNRIAAVDESIQPTVVDCGYSLDQFVGEEETPSAVVQHSYFDVSRPMVQAIGQQHYVPVSFDRTEATPLQSSDAPELSSAPFVNMQDPYEEDLLKDYLEMDDLESDLNIQTHDKWGMNMGAMQFDEFDGLNNLYVNPSSSLCDPVEPWHDFQLDSRVMDPNVNTTQNYAMQQQYNNSNGASYQVWRSEPTFSTVTTSEANQSFNAPSNSGDPCQNQNNGSVSGENGDETRGEVNGDTGSRFSSAIWSYLESIPTSPASASEAILVDKVCERTSLTLSRVRIVAGNTKVAATSTSYGKSRVGFLCFSILGVICAILWMVAVTSKRVIGLCS